MLAMTGRAPRPDVGLHHRSALEIRPTTPMKDIRSLVICLEGVYSPVISGSWEKRSLTTQLSLDYLRMLLLTGIQPDDLLRDSSRAVASCCHWL